MSVKLDESDDNFDVGFEQFRLKPGLELELHNAAGRKLDFSAQFVMSQAGISVLLAVHTSDPATITLKPGEPCRVSGFNGRFDYSFDTKVIKVDAEQRTVLLTAPEKVSLHFVRKHQRTELVLPATVSIVGASTPLAVTVRNISLGGAAVDSVKMLGPRGGKFTLNFDIIFEGKKETLELESVIRRTSESGESLMFTSGVEFTRPSREEKLLLHYHITSLTNEFNLI